MLKYTVTIMLCYFFIKRSGELVVKCERKKFKRLFVYVILFSSTVIVGSYVFSIISYVTSGNRRELDI